MTPSRTVSVSIARPPADVYEFLADPARLPRWSGFITAIAPDGDTWLATVPGQVVRIRFLPRNPHGVLDHWVTAEGRPPVYVPIRVLANGTDAAEVIFTIFRGREMTDADFAADVAMVESDLASLRRLLESRSTNPEEA